MEGLYFNKTEELIRFFRFYNDGYVLGASISATDFESSDEDTSWFVSEKNDLRIVSDGHYTLLRESISRLRKDYIQISFKLSLNLEEAFYTGWISNSEKMNLSFAGEEGDIQTFCFSRYYSKLEKKLYSKKFQGYLGLMLKFSRGEILEEFGQQYIIENRRNKFDEIINIINNSDKVKEYISNLKFNSLKPKPIDLQYLLNSHSYFAWAKEETVCFGSLGVIVKWSHCNHKGENDDLVNKLMAETIDYSSELKYNRVNNFFHRYYRRLKLILDSKQF